MIHVGVASTEGSGPLGNHYCIGENNDVEMGNGYGAVELLLGTIPVEAGARIGDTRRDGD